MLGKTLELVSLAQVAGRLPKNGEVSQFEFRFSGKGPTTSLKNGTYSAMEIIATHQGLSTIGNKNISSHNHQVVTTDCRPIL